MASFYCLAQFQRKTLSIYMDKFGVDAGVAVILDFENGVSLGKAMIKHKPRPEQGGIEHENNNGESVQV